MDGDDLFILVIVTAGIIGVIYIIINYWKILIMIIAIIIILIITYYIIKFYRENEETESNIYEDFPKIKQNKHLTTNQESKTKPYEHGFKHENILKGELFEEFIKNMFNENFFKILNETPSAFDNEAEAEEVMKPDLYIKERLTDEKFWIECKFRSKTKENGSIEWTDIKHKKIYEKFGKESNSKVFIAIGIGSNPSNPDKIFFLDLDSTPYLTLYESFYKKYEFPKDHNFKNLNELKQKCCLKDTYAQTNCNN
ncbi:MAG: hypothetical protein FWC29_02140 [Methanomassiliicoccaceae archaeon]|nr:hypothetical protein [Methanomassiliicoccaceae archaeon]